MLTKFYNFMKLEDDMETYVDNEESTDTSDIGDIIRDVYHITLMSLISILSGMILFAI